MFKIRREHGMAQQDQGHHTSKSQKLKRLPLTHWIIFIVALLLIAVGTLILILYNHNTWSSVLPYQAALNIHRDVGNLEGEGTALNALGLVYNNLGHKEQAREYYKQALKIRREISDRKGESITLRNLGVIYFVQICYDVALTALLVARFIFEEIQSPIREFTQSMIDTLHEKVGDEQFTIIFAQVEPKASQIVEQALGEESVFGTGCQ
jgi:tetratricopeptide (TPR) repeat protein